MNLLHLSSGLLLLLFTPVLTLTLALQDLPSTTQLYTCPPTWTFFCFRDSSTNPPTSACECYRMSPPTTTCPPGTTKYCSDYITTECSCSYSKQPDCPPMFDFECMAATGKEAQKVTWVCMCKGKVYGEMVCPRGFTSRCGPGGYLQGEGEGERVSGDGKRSCMCKKVRSFLSEYTPRPKGKEMQEEGEWQVQMGEVYRAELK